MKRYEFSYRSNDMIVHFVVLWDENIYSACERVLGRPVGQEELKTSINRNYFITGWEDTHFTIYEQEAHLPVSSHTSLGPEAKQVIVHKHVRVNDVLAGLL